MNAATLSPRLINVTIRRWIWKTLSIAAILGSGWMVLRFTCPFDVDNPASRMATIDALVHDHTFAINNSLFHETRDKALLSGNYYSTKPFLQSVLAAVGYTITWEVSGISFHNDRNHAIILVNLLNGLIPHMLCLFYSYRLLRRWVRRWAIVFLGCVAVAYGCLSTGYAISISNHTPAAALWLMTVFHADRALSDGGGSWDTFLAGLFAGLLSAVDLPSTILGAVVLIQFWRCAPNETPVFLLMFLLPNFVQEFLNVYATGSVIPLELRRNLFLWPDSPWYRDMWWEQTGDSKLLYLFHMTFGHHGLFLMTPLLLIGAIESAKRSMERSPIGRIAAQTFICFLVLMTFYELYTTHYGGSCYGLRWMIPMMPILILFATVWLDRRPTPPRTLLFLSFLAVGVTTTYFCLREGPWRQTRWEMFLRRNL